MSDQLPEAREAAVAIQKLDCYGRKFTPETLTEEFSGLIAQACIAYHKRRLEECGDAKDLIQQIAKTLGWYKDRCRVAGDLGWTEDYTDCWKFKEDRRSFDSLPPEIGKVAELLQLHTAKAVEKATRL